MATDPTPDSGAAPIERENVMDAELVFLEEAPDGSAQEKPPAKSRSSKTDATQRTPFAGPPSSWREWLGLGAIVVLADVAIYRSYGLAGFALFLAATPALLTLASPVRRINATYWLLLAMAVLLAAKTLWCGTALGVGVGVALLVGIAMTLSGQRPYILELCVYAWQTIPAGIAGILFHARNAAVLGRPLKQFNWLATVLPIIALVVFSALFILANPNLFAAFGENLEYVLSTLHSWMSNFAPSPVEMVFWLGVLWLAAGLLRPILKGPLLRETPRADSRRAAEEHLPAPLYSAYRNTLLTVILLFAVYLIFEFKTLWFRTFPEGFHYSGYAHEGAAWLTVALAVATVVLSVIFRGQLLRDDRLPTLRRLAWVWSALNLLLAIAVYNRLYIYIGFNGMTRMRIIGIFGITAVVIGFLLVIYKISRSRSLLWLLRNQMAALALLVFLFTLLPIDYLVVRYNVQRILAGDPAPSVQISVHPIDAVGVAQLRPLVQCDDPIIRDGVAAMLAQRQNEAEAQAARHARLGWTTFQWADRAALDRLQSEESAWAEYADPQKRETALKRFHEYAYQWY